jgi:hypothetical protein
LVILRVPILKELFIEIVAVTAPALSNIAVSWASGKLPTAGEPPLLNAHAVADQGCDPAKFQ